MAVKGEVATMAIRQHMYQDDTAIADANACAAQNVVENYDTAKLRPHHADQTHPSQTKAVIAAAPGIGLYDAGK